MQRGIPHSLKAAPFSGVALGWRGGMLRARQGGEGGSRPGGRVGLTRGLGREPEIVRVRNSVQP